MGPFSSLIASTEGMDGLYIPQSNCEKMMPYTEPSRSSSHLSSSHSQDAPEELKLASNNLSPLSIASLEGKQIRRRSGKMASSSSGCSKKSRMGQVDDLSLNEVEADDVKEKSQMSKTKNGLNGKRVDRRNGKVSMKSKYDFFSLKSGMLTFSSGGGGNNSLGVSGSKPEAYDIKNYLEEVTVKDLLGGPSEVKNKAKAAASVSGNVGNSMTMAFSILQRKKPVKVQTSAEIDDGNNWDVSGAQVCVHESDVNEKGDTCLTDLSSQAKVPPKVLDFPMCRPKDILERVVLPSPVGLDALLVDAAKPVNFPKDALDSRGKQIAQRTSLPSSTIKFSSTGKQISQRTILPSSETIKFSTSRSSCHGKWTRIDNTVALFQGRTNFPPELECLNYDPKLVPVKSRKCYPSANHAAPCAPASSIFIDFCSSSTATCTRPSQLSIESGGNLILAEDGERSPGSLVAAQTICSFKKQFPEQEHHQRMTWTSKPSDKTIKACRSKADNEFGEISAKPELVVSSHALLNSKEASPVFKKPRLLIKEKGKEINTGAKGLVSWSMPKASTHSPSRPYRDNHTNAKSYNSFMMPPPTSRVFDKASNSRQKLR